ncbi:MAG: hypothetical protein KIS91_06195 [Anaerolineae bacterium]|nr:hypothetical protein [Anaerolineae bacterium]
MVRFADGRIDRADMLIAADGIYSVVRTQLFDKHKPRYAGYTAWRGVATLDEPALPADTALRVGDAASGLVWYGLVGACLLFATQNAPSGQCRRPPGGTAAAARRLARTHTRLSLRD